MQVAPDGDSHVGATGVIANFVEEETGSLAIGAAMVGVGAAVGAARSRDTRHRRRHQNSIAMRALHVEKASVPTRRVGPRPSRCDSSTRCERALIL